MAAPVLAGIAVGGALLSSYAQFQASRAEAKLLRRQSELLDLSAEQIIELNEENTRLIREDVDKLQGTARTKFAAGGVVTDLEALSQIAVKGEEEIRMRTEEAEFNAEMARLEAEIMRENARATRRAGTLRAIGTLASSAALFRK